MVQRLSIILAILAWACLASPWQACASDCRGGALLPFVHDCHDDGCAGREVAELHVDDDCEHRVRDDRSGPEGALRCRCRHSDSRHVSLLLSQCEPEPRLELVVAPSPREGDDDPDHRDWRSALLAPRFDMLADPPDGVPRPKRWGESRSGASRQAVLQLRTTILLL